MNAGRDLTRPLMADHFNFPKMLESFISAAEAVLVAVGRDSRVPDILAADVAGSYHELRPRPGLPLFIIGDARHGGLGQVGMAIGDGLAAAAMAVEAIG